MEIFILKLHTKGDENCLKNVINYPIGGKQVMQTGFGVNPYNSEAATNQFIQTTRYWNNQGKTPVYHYILSFSKETVQTPVEAMIITNRIFDPIIANHLTLVGIHQEKREDSYFHSHIVVCPTNFRNGNMLHANNRINFYLSFRAACITNQLVKFILKKDDDSVWICPKIFDPDDVKALPEEEWTKYFH